MIAYQMPLKGIQELLWLSQCYLSTAWTTGIVNQNMKFDSVGQVLFYVNFYCFRLIKISNYVIVLLTWIGRSFFQSCLKRIFITRDQCNACSKVCQLYSRRFANTLGTTTN